MALCTFAPAAPLLCLADDGDVLHLERLTVSTGTRTERLITEVPIRTEVLLCEDIQMRGAFNFSQAADLLNGVRVESNCQNCNTTEVQLLGLGGAYNRILFDGTPLLSALGGVYGLEQIPAGFVDRMEVVKGGGSALYGADAVAGVINLVPTEPSEFGGFLQAGVDLQKDVPLWVASGRVNLVDARRRLAISITGQGAINNGIDFNDDGYTEITKKQLGVGGIMAWWRPRPGTSLRADLQYTRETRRGGNRLNAPEYLSNIAESIETEYFRGGVSWHQNVSETVDFRVAYSYTRIDRDSFYGGLGDVVTDPALPGYDATQLDPFTPGSAASKSYNQYGTTTNPLHYVDTQFNYRVASHAIAVGAQYKQESINDLNLNGAGEELRVLNDGDYSNVGIFAQDEWQASDALMFVLGARLDKSSELDNPVVSPRFAASLRASDRLTFRASVSTGFRAPELFSEDLHVETLGEKQVRIRNAPGLEEESMITYMAGFEWRSSATNPIWAADVTLSMAEISDTFSVGDIRTAEDGSLYQERENAGGSSVAGAEANLTVRPWSTVTVSAGVAYYHSRFDDPQVVFDGPDADGIPVVIATRDYLKTPDWSGVMQASWLPSRLWEIFAGLKYTGPMDVLNNNAGELRRSPDFWNVDVGLTRHIPLKGGHELDISIGAKNIFDQRQHDLESGPGRDSTYVYGPRYARSVYLTMRYEF